MKLNSFLAYLTEAVDINELRQKVGDEVPAEVLDKLAAKMKGKKYDNIAMAIIKKIQDINTSKKQYSKEAAPYIRFLKEYPNVVYSALKKAANGNPNFDPKEMLEDYVLLAPHMSNTTPKKYWYDVYTSTKPAKTKKEQFGLKNAKVRELKDEYLIFPKTFKRTGNFGLSENDLEKQWQDIRALSYEIAKKDTSGEEVDDMKATDNHWCVASSDSNYYQDYKEHGGTFVIVVKKNEDGSPNWNDRYLYYGRWYSMKDGFDDANDEFADKFDRHISQSRVLSSEAAKILDNLSKKPSKTEKQNAAADRRIHLAYKDYSENSSRTNTKEWQAFRTLVNTINKWIYQQNKAIKSKNEGDYFTYGDFRKTISDILAENKIQNGKSLFNYMNRWGDNRPVYHREEGNYDFQLEEPYGGEGSVWYFIVFADVVNAKNKPVAFTTSGSLDEIVDRLKEEAGKTNRQHELIQGIAYDTLYSRANFGRAKTSFHPKTNYVPEKYLRGNKEITRAFEHLKTSRETESTFLPCGIVVEKFFSNGRFTIFGKKRFSEGKMMRVQICDLTDPDMVEKVKKYLDEYNAAGLKKVDYQQYF